MAKHKVTLQPPLSAETIAAVVPSAKRIIGSQPTEIRILFWQ